MKVHVTKQPCSGPMKFEISDVRLKSLKFCFTQDLVLVSTGLFPKCVLKQLYCYRINLFLFSQYDFAITNIIHSIAYGPIFIALLFILA